MTNADTTMSLCRVWAMLEAYGHFKRLLLDMTAEDIVHLKGVQVAMEVAEAQKESRPN